MQQDRLKVARLRMNLSQEEVAERLQIDAETYRRWEGGKTQPRPYNKRQLYTLLQIESSAEEDAQTGHPTRTLRKEEMGDETCEEAQTFISQDLTQHLQSIAFLPYQNHHELRNRIAQIIKDFDTMNADNKNYQTTRRDALRRVATFPLLMLGLSNPAKILSSVQHSAIVANCATSVEACWELFKRSNDASDYKLVFQCASKYMAVLQTIAKESSQYRKQALDLATRYALLKTYVGWSCVGPTETIQYAKDAVTLR